MRSIVRRLVRRRHEAIDIRMRTIGGGVMPSGSDRAGNFLRPDPLRRHRKRSHGRRISGTRRPVTPEGEPCKHGSCAQFH
jgi:hypothetical protein